MPRTARRISESGIYHVTARGAGRRTIFEDSEDKNHFMRKLKDTLLANRISLLAWCLMDNHYHLIMKGDLEDITQSMRQINTSLAHWYNGRYGHVGPVLQGRFSSTPIETDSHLMEAVRYVHMNPRDRGEANFRDYVWSSYRNYTGTNGICDTSIVMGVFGGLAQFESFHEIGKDSLEIIENKPRRTILSDAEARDISSSLFGESYGDKLAVMECGERRRALKRLHEMGISIRQLERLTGIGRGIIQPAVK